MLLSTTQFKQFREEVARTLFVQAWADWKERYGGGYAPGCQLFKVAPATPPEAYEAADRLIDRLDQRIAPIEVIAQRAYPTWHSRGNAFVKDLAFCLTMSSLGHGVGWTDDFESFEGCRGVDFEFSYYDLNEKDYPIEEEI